MAMNIASTQYSLAYRALEIYLSGCDGACAGCHNPELWDFNQGTDYTKWYPSLASKLTTFPKLIQNIWILGGEPLLQDHGELETFLRWLQPFDIPITLWTRFQLEDVPLPIQICVSYIKTGSYRSDLACPGYEMYGIPLVSTNQRIEKPSLQ